MLSPRTALFAAAIGLFALIAACGGDGDGDATPEPRVLTAEEAATLAQSALLTQEDLPNADWTVEDVDRLEGEQSEGGPSDDLFGSTPACQEIAAAFEQLGADETTDSLANLERSFETSDDGSLMMRSVLSGIVVPDPSVDVDETFASLREVLTADSIRPCFEAGMVAAMEDEGGLVVSRIDVDTPENVVENGVAIAMDLEAIALVVPLNLRLELHMWPAGQAVGNLMVMEMNSDLLARNMGSILENAQQRLAEAVAAAQ